MSDLVRRFIAGLCCILLLAASAESAAYGQPASTADEQRSKAAFVYRFAQFVEWPPDALADRTSLEICVSAPSTYSAALNELVAGESLGGRPIIVREVEANDTLESCHLLFALPAPGGDKATLLPRAAPLPILTVGDDPTFLEDGGIINLRIIDRSVRFEINTAAAERAGLRLSSQLLRLAVKIVDGTP